MLRDGYKKSHNGLVINWPQDVYMVPRSLVTYVSQSKEIVARVGPH